MGPVHFFLCANEPSAGTIDPRRVLIATQLKATHILPLEKDQKNGTFGEKKRKRKVLQFPGISSAFLGAKPRCSH